MVNSCSCCTCFFRPVLHQMVVMSLIVSICLALPCHAAYNDWAEGSQAAADGATRDYYNRAGKLEWDNYLGDWRDTDDIAQGASAYATSDIVDNNTPPATLNGMSGNWFSNGLTAPIRIRVFFSMLYLERAPSTLEVKSMGMRTSIPNWSLTPAAVNRPYHLWPIPISHRPCTAVWGIRISSPSQ